MPRSADGSAIGVIVASSAPAIAIAGRAGRLARRVADLRAPPFFAAAFRVFAPAFWADLRAVPPFREPREVFALPLRAARDVFRTPRFAAPFLPPFRPPVF